MYENVLLSLIVMGQSLMTLGVGWHPPGWLRHSAATVDSRVL